MKPSSSSEEYILKLKELWTVLSQHIKEEEESDLPALESALSKSDAQSASTIMSSSNESESEKMARQFGRTKAFVPSRSHPSAGENPYFESALGLLVAPIDHVADIFRKFPDETVSPNPSTK